MSHAPDSPFRVPERGWSLSEAPTFVERDDETHEKSLKRSIKRLRKLQNRLYAADRHALLLVFQAMDAAGKDSTIRAVLSGVNPQGCEVHSFGRPSSEELGHDFLWRTSTRLPRKGRIGVFNRSYYEELLVVRVNPGILDGQRLPEVPDSIWVDRERSIRDHEAHLARNGTVVLKFFLNVSAEEQRRRLLARIDTPEKNWKFDAGDLATRAQWEDYMGAYETTLNATSRDHAPWYAIPADDKPFMRATVADLVVRALESIDPQYPELDPEDVLRLGDFREELG